MSQFNMSDIKQSIEEYSMNFQNSHDQSAISEMISVSKTGYNFSISKNSIKPVKKSFVNIIDKELSKPPIKKTQESIIEEAGQKQNASGLQENNNQNNEPVFLGDHIFKIIKERYRQVQGIDTNEADALFDFYKRQKKNFQPEKAMSKNLKMEAISNLMPSAQRKMLLKIQFEKILLYYPNDVYYTLVCGSQKIKKDQQIQNKANKLNYLISQRPQSQKKNMKQVVDRLYQFKKPVEANKNKLKQDQQKQKRRQFGTRLIQHFLNHFKNNSDPPEPSAEKLYEFWQETYEREQHGIDWNQHKAKDDIKLYMVQQVKDLIMYFEKKLGFKQLNFHQIKKFYAQYKPIDKIFIPLNYLKCFINAYNDILKEQEQKKAEEEQKQIKQAQEKKKQAQIKKFKRPVSATPITVLSKPKNTSNCIQLFEKYSKDKILNSIKQQKIKIARKPFQYGIFNIQDQIKTKGRIKPKTNQNFDQTIFKLVNQTFTDKNFFNVKDEDRVRHILGQEDIQKAQNWKQFGPILQQAMLVKCYEQDWFREALVKYCTRTVNKEFKYSDDKTVVQELIRFLNGLEEDKRGSQIENLDKVINTSQTIAQRTEQIKKLSRKGSNVQMKQKKLFYSFLQEKACEFIDLRIKRKQVNLRQFLNDVFKTAMKDHKQFVVKYFRVVTGDKQCPKLLKYEFFRLQKQINPFTKQKDSKSKCHIWIPTKASPQNLYYSSFNSYSNAYKVEKNKILSKQESQNHKNSIWGYKKDKVKERQSLMMTYDDAKQCVFHPKISKMI